MDLGLHAISGSRGFFTAGSGPAGLDPDLLAVQQIGRFDQGQLQAVVLQATIIEVVV